MLKKCIQNYTFSLKIHKSAEIVKKKPKSL